MIPILELVRYIEKYLSSYRADKQAMSYGWTDRQTDGRTEKGDDNTFPGLEQGLKRHLRLKAMLPLR